MDYFRSLDDILILCKTKRQHIHCKQHMIDVLKERGLRLASRKRLQALQ
ncbi:hypothetical protein [Legionella sp. km535]|nr:hypothetical protein [Legionella sp. km535]